MQSLVANTVRLNHIKEPGANFEINIFSIGKVSSSRMKLKAPKAMNFKVPFTESNLDTKVESATGCTQFLEEWMAS